jgi:hypothetical protein
MAFMGNPPPATVATLTRSIRFTCHTIDLHVFRAADKDFYPMETNLPLIVVHI